MLPIAERVLAVLGISGLAEAHVVVCNRVNNEHPDTLACALYHGPTTHGFGCLELVALV